jgi:hypothetical protein
MKAAMLTAAIAACGSSDTNSPMPATPQDRAVLQIAWRHVDLPRAGVSVDQHPAWETIEDDRVVYQRFSSDGLVSVRWGTDATIEDALAHVGLGTGGGRVIEADAPAEIAGRPARRIRIRIIGPEATSHDPGNVAVPERELIYVAVGFTAGDTPVLVSYRLAASTVVAMTPLVEHVLASVRTR